MTTETDTPAAPEPAEPRPAHHEPRRRPMAAGHVIVALLVAALVGGVLNAAGIRKTANGQAVGTKRDVARFFADPMYDLSHTLRLDQLRRGIQAIAGRSGDDDINASLPDPVITDVNPNSPTTSTTVPPKKRAFSPSTKMRVWVGGDSLSVTPGESFLNAAPGTEVIDVVNASVDGHIATGLARPEVFNWAQHLADVVNQDQPDAVVFTVGSNDDQTLTGDGGGAPYGSAEWTTEYRRRVGGLMDQVTANSQRVMFWLGVPPIRTRADDRYFAMNDIVREEAAKRAGRVVYIDLDKPFRGADGGYVDYLNDVQVRTPDGIHFTRSGGDQVANFVLEAMNRTFDLTSWRDKTPTTIAPTTNTTTPASTTPGSTNPGTTTTTKRATNN